VYGSCRTFTGPPRPGAPFLHHLRRPVVILLRLKGLCSTASQVLLACPTSRKCTRRDFGLDLPRPDCLRDYKQSRQRRDSRSWSLCTCSRSLTPGSRVSTRLAHSLILIAFPIAGQGRHSRTVISELNTAPVHTPTNASPRHHWSSTHSSGPERIATPFSVEDLALKASPPTPCRS
jgi:hypothetical protein